MSPFRKMPRELVVHILRFDPRFAELFRRVPRVRASPSDIAPALAYDGNHRNVMDELHRRLCFWRLDWGRKGRKCRSGGRGDFRSSRDQVQDTVGYWETDYARQHPNTRAAIPDDLLTVGLQFITDVRSFPVRDLMRGRTFVPVLGCDDVLIEWAKYRR